MDVLFGYHTHSLVRIIILLVNRTLEQRLYFGCLSRELRPPKKKEVAKETARSRPSWDPNIHHDRPMIARPHAAVQQRITY